MQKKKVLNYNVYIIGFMGVGKSTIMRVFEREYRMDCIDLDNEIEKAEGRSINRIFAEDGEEYFRRKETETLERLSRRRNTIISCGGGTPLREENRTVMKKGKVVCLYAPEKTVLKRIRRRHTRPLVENKDDSFVLDLLHEREAIYRSCADICINTDEDSPSGTAARILEQLI